MHVSLILPSYNEEHRLGDTLESLAKYRASCPYDLEIIVVDDGSADNTAAVAEAAREILPDLIVARHTKNRGKGRAVATGMLLGSGEYRAFFDADGATPFEALDDLLACAMTDRKTVAIGSLRVNGTEVVERQPLVRTLVGSLGNRFIRAVVLPGVADSQRGCKVFAGDVAEVVFGALDTNGWGFDIEVLARCRKLGLNITEIPVEWTHIDGGQIRAWSYASTLREVMRIRKLMRQMPASKTALSTTPAPPFAVVARKPA